MADRAIKGAVILRFPVYWHLFWILERRGSPEQLSISTCVADELSLLATFKIFAENADETRAFYAAQRSYTPDQEVLHQRQAFTLVDCRPHRIAGPFHVLAAGASLLPKQALITPLLPIVPTENEMGDDFLQETSGGAPLSWGSCFPPSHNLLS